MAEKTLLDARGDVLKTVQTDSGDPDRLILVTEQDVAPVIELAKEIREYGNWTSEMKPVAEIPMVIVEQMMRDGSWNDPAAIRRWCNDPQNSCFRIVPGTV